MSGGFPAPAGARRSVRMTRPTALALAAALALACSRGGDEQARRRLFSHEEAAAGAAAPFDPARPESALALSADEAARRLGSFEWTAAVDWSVARDGGDDAARLHATERHRLRQSASGEFDVDAEVDPGLGPGSEAGRQVIWAGGMTYARSRYAPFGAFRERPTDRGRDARRFRDESFNLLGDLAGLYGATLALEPAGDATALGRPAKRYRFALAGGDPPAPPAGRTFATNGPDEDTRRHLAFLEGRVPVEASGELLADAATGVPLRAHLKGAFGVKEDPKARARFELFAEVKSIGSAVAAVAAPRSLPDARKPNGVEDALQAAGLKKKAEAPGEEPGDEGD